jgi:hypothetical protein
MANPHGCTPTLTQVALFRNTSKRSVHTHVCGSSVTMFLWSGEHKQHHPYAKIG